MERKSSKKRSTKKSVKSKPKEEKAKVEQRREEEPETQQHETCVKRESENKTIFIEGTSITQAERDGELLTINKKGMSKEEIRAAYNVLSKEGNGKMGIKEVKKLLQSQFMTFTDNQAIEVFHKLDQDGNGEIDFEEFEKYVIENNLNKPSQEEFGADMKDAFEMFDTDKNGYIDAQEFKACMMMLGDKMADEEVTEMMKEADANGDGKIDYAEFCAHMSKSL